MSRCLLIFSCLVLCACSSTEDTADQCQGDCSPDMEMMDSTPDAGNEPDPDATIAVGRAELIPERFEFSFVGVGDSQAQPIRVENAGEGPLVLQGFAAAFSNQYVLYLNPDDSGRPLGEQEVLVRGDQSTFPETIELQPGDAIRFTLVYEPTEGGQRGGQFSFTADREIRIPIEHSDDRPEFMQDPVSLDFGRVEAGGRKLEIIKVTNVGTAIGTLEEVSISGSDIFSITIEGRDPQEEPRVLDNPDRDPELGVGLGKAFDILVRCTPENDEPADAEVRILSDATNEEILIPVRANYPEETP